MKKSLAILLAAAMLLIAAPLAGYATDPVPEGFTGITDAEGLYAVRNDLGGSYFLLNDIDLTELTAEGGDFDLGYGWTPIGADDSHMFTGVFDGNGHTVTGLQTRGKKAYSSLFGYVSGGTVKNLRLEDVSVYGGQYIGGLVGYMDNATVQDCSFTGNVTGTGSYVGGLIGCAINNSTVKNCCSTGTVTGTSNVGGLIGHAVYVTISQCYNTAEVNGASNVGGICGYGGINVSLTDCYNTGAITATDVYAGGLLGLSDSYSLELTHNLNYGVISGNSGTGAICGAMNGSYFTLSECYYLRGTAEKGCSNVEDSAGGANALTPAMAAKQSYYGYLDFENVWCFDSNSGVTRPQLKALREVADSGMPVIPATHDDVVPEGFTGVWTAEELYAIRYKRGGKYILFNDIDLTELTAEGGDFDLGYGWTPIGADSNHKFTGVFDGNGHTISGLQTRGEKAYRSFFGYVYGGTVKNLRLEDVSVYGWQYVGGLVGYMDNNATVQDCSVSGNVTGTGTYVGGLIGYTNYACTVKNCCVTGAVTGSSDYVGGLIGYAGDASTVKNCCVTGAVTGSSDYVGGLIGSMQSIYAVSNSIVSSTVSKCYNAATVNGSSYVGGICGYNNGRISLTDCYNTGAITATSKNAGGLLGLSESYTYKYTISYSRYSGYTYGYDYGYTTISHSLNYGTVSGNSGTGAICGVKSGSDFTLSECYYLRGTAEKGCSNVEDSAGGANALTPAMAAKPSYYGYLDFDVVWSFDAESGVSHPQLQSIPETKVVSLSINAADAKTVYLQNEALSVEGLLLTATYPNGATVTHAVKETMVSGFDASVLGPQTLTVRYCNATAGYTIRVCDPISSVTLSRSTATYNGSEQNPTVTVKNATGTQLTEGTDYTVTVPDGRIDTGEYVYTVTGKGAYTGTVTKTFTIEPQPLIGDNIVLSPESVAYDGTVKSATVTVRNEAGATLIKDQDYTLSVPSGRTEVGTYNYTVIGKGNYSGSVIKTFTITPHTVHNWDSGVIITPATCVQTGEIEYNCVICGVTKTETILTGVHNYGAWESIDGESHRRVCANDPSHVETEVHTWNDGEVTIPATKDADGVKTYTCTVCGETKAEAIPYTGPEMLDTTRISYSPHTFYANGKQQQPTVTVKNAVGQVLTEGTDYTITYPVSVDPGDYMVRVDGINGYKGTVYKRYIIKTVEALDTSRISYSPHTFYANGRQQQPTVTVSNAAGKTLVEGTDYTLTCPVSIEPGDYMVKIDGINGYKGTVYKRYIIKAVEALETSRISYSPKSFFYNGQQQQPTVTVTNAAGKTLVEGMDYTIAYPVSVEPGSYMVRIDGINGYKATVRKAYTIKAVEALETSRITYSPKTFFYNGQQQQPTVTVKNEAGKTLVEGTDYTITYPVSIEPGSYMVRIDGINGYKATVRKAYIIKAVEALDTYRITYSPNTFYANGKQQQPTVTVKNAAGKVLTEGVDYTVTYPESVEPDSYLLRVDGINGYKGTVYKRYIIKAIEALETSRITYSPKTFFYNGQQQQPAVTVTNAAGKTLVEGTDYTITYPVSIEPGSYMVRIDGINGYRATVRKAYIIKAVEALDTSRITYSPNTFFYTGKQQQPTVKVTNEAGKTLTEGVDYTVTFPESIDPGSYMVRIDGINGYKGTVRKRYIIKAVEALDTSRITRTPTTFTCNGEQQQPEVTVKNVAGKVLIEGVDYKVTYPVSVEPGSYLVQINGINGYTGMVRKGYTIK